MKQEINEKEVKKLNRYGALMGVLMLAMVILPVPLLKWLDTVGFLLVMVPLFTAGMFVAFLAEKVKKDNDVHTYKEIVAFAEGKRLDELEKAREEGKRPYQQILLAVGAGLIALAVMALMFWLVF